MKIVMTVHPHILRAFVAESNRIEGITREPTDAEVAATRYFLNVEAPTTFDIINLVDVLQPGAVIRDQIGLNVRVGDHHPPPGHPRMVEWLHDLLYDARWPEADPWLVHCRYETLHPFTDGNGRSGRALWAWMQVRRGDDLVLGFLHRFYYQTLSAYRG